MTEEGLQGLKFEGSLIKTRNSDELFSLLETLTVELGNLEQEQTDLSTLRNVSQELISSRLIKNKNAGIRALTACCLMEVLRIHAPDAPYSIDVLKSIFEFFFKEFPNLSKPSYPYFSRLYHLLENMAQVQCIALVPDFPDPEPIVIKVFESFYEIACARDQVAGIEYYLGSILSQLIGEYQALPQSVTELILSHLLRGGTTPQSKDPKNLSLTLNVSRGYTISKEICTENIDIMIRHVNQYFSDIFTGFHENEDSLEDDTELEKTQKLLIEMWKAVPELLSSIVSQLEQELSIENLPLRLMATNTIGQMISIVPSRVSFLRDHHAAFSLWMGRIRDKDTKVRMAWTEGAFNVILSRTDQSVKEVVPLFMERLSDSDEHVRETACRCLANFPIDTFVNKFPVDSQGACLPVLAERIRDKRHLVRATAFETVGKIYNEAYNFDASDLPYTRFSWIPTSLFETVLLNDKDVNELLDATLFNYIFPQTNDDEKRTRRILSVCKSLSSSAWKAFSAMSQRQLRLAKVFNSLLTNIKTLHSPDCKGAQKKTIQGKASGLIDWFAKQFSSEEKMTHILNQIVESKDKQAYKLLSTCVSQDQDYKTIVKASAEVLKKFKNDPILRILLHRMSYLIYNKSIIAPVVALTRNTLDPLHETAQHVLKDISLAMPSLLKSQIQHLVSILETAEPGQEGNVNTLKAAARLFKEFASEVPQSNVLMKSLKNIALNGTTNEAKQAINALQCSERKEMHWDDLMNDIVYSLDEDNNELLEKLSTRLAALAQLYSHIPTALEENQNIIMKYLVQNVLLKDCDDGLQEQSDKDWVEDKEINKDCLSRMMAIRVMVNRLRAIAGWENAKELSQPVFKLLSTIIGNGGDIHPDKSLPLVYKSRLRLDAGIKLLKLAKIDFYNKMITADDFNLLVFLIQDSCLPVRERFARTLTRYLSAPQTISDRYLPLLFMGALEPDKDLNTYTTTWLRARYQKQQAQNNANLVMEKSFARVLYLVANHQDLFDDNEDEDKQGQDILTATKYILHYLKLIATEQNIAVIFYVAQKIKEYNDVNEGRSETLYLVSDLAQFIILKFVNFKSWNMETWPGSMSLPLDIFRPIKVASEKVAKTLYFPDQYHAQVQEAVRSSLRHHHQRSNNDDEQNNGPAKKRTSKRKSNTTTKRAKTGASAAKKSKQTYGGPVRQSSRNRKQINYGEDDGSEENDNDEEDEDEDE